MILYERLTGQTPFAGENALTLLRQVRETEPPRPSTIRPGLDRDLETVVLKCLDKEPDRRYSSAEALADDLENWLAGRPIAARPVGRTERAWRWCKRNPAVAGLAALVALSLILGVVISGGFAVAERRARIRARPPRIAPNAPSPAVWSGHWILRATRTTMRRCRNQRYRRCGSLRNPEAKLFAFASWTKPRTIRLRLGSSAHAQSRL